MSYLNYLMILTLHSISVSLVKMNCSPNEFEICLIGLLTLTLTVPSFPGQLAKLNKLIWEISISALPTVFELDDPDPSWVPMVAFVID